VHVKVANALLPMPTLVDHKAITIFGQAQNACNLRNCSLDFWLENCDIYLIKMPIPSTDQVTLHRPQWHRQSHPVLSSAAEAHESAPGDFPGQSRTTEHARKQQYLWVQVMKRKHVFILKHNFRRDFLCHDLGEDRFACWLLRTHNVCEKDRIRIRYHMKRKHTLESTVGFDAISLDTIQ
jgi:hypothetical protein